DGKLTHYGGRLNHLQDREKGGVLGTMGRHMAFTRRPKIAVITQSTSFDPSQLVHGKMAVFIVPSMEHGDAVIGWTRMVLDGMLKAVMRCGLQEKRLVTFIIDEASKLGQMDALRQALDAGAGYGIRCLFIYQSAGQLNRCWPQGEAQSLLAQTAQIYFSVN